MKSTQCCAGWISNRLWLYSNRPNVSAVIYEKEINPPFNLPWSFFFSSDGVKHIFQLRQPAARSLTRPSCILFIFGRQLNSVRKLDRFESLLLFAELMPANFWIPPIFFRFWRNFFFLFLLIHPLCYVSHRDCSSQTHLWQERNTSAASRISLQISNLKVSGGGRSRTQPKSRLTSGGEGSRCGSTVSLSGFVSNKSKPRRLVLEAMSWSEKKKRKKLKIERLRIKRSFRRRVNNALLSLGKFNGKEKLLRRKRASKDDERWGRKRDREEKN